MLNSWLSHIRDQQAAQRERPRGFFKFKYIPLTDPAALGILSGSSAFPTADCRGTREVAVAHATTSICAAPIMLVAHNSRASAGPPTVLESWARTTFEFEFDSTAEPAAQGANNTNRTDNDMEATSIELPSSGLSGSIGITIL